MAKRKVPAPVVEQVPETEETDLALGYVSTETDKEDQKKFYFNMLEQTKEVRDKLVSDCAKTFAVVSTTALIEIAQKYKVFPFNYEPKVADALVFELSKRGRKQEVKQLSQDLSECTWYTEPWSRY